MDRLVVAVVHVGGRGVQGPAAGVGDFWSEQQQIKRQTAVFGSSPVNQAIDLKDQEHLPGSLSGSCSFK